jgi:CRP-like cAMP-binding protein
MSNSSPSLLTPVTQNLQEFASHSVLSLPPNCLWRIEAGFVRTITWLEDGTVIVLGIWGPGEFVGRWSSISPYQIQCITRIEVASIPIDQFSNLAEITLAHLRKSEELMVIRSYKRVDLMLLKLLSWLADRFGKIIDRGRLIDLRLTHHDLSELLGTTRVTVTRSLNQLEQQGAIQRLSSQRIIVQADDFWHYEI